MYIILEFEELRELGEMIQHKLDPDVPVDYTHPDAPTLHRISHFLDAVILQEPEICNELYDLVCDDALLETANRILTKIFSNGKIRESFQWMKVIDQYGGLVIRLNLGDKNG